MDMATLLVCYVSFWVFEIALNYLSKKKKKIALKHSVKCNPVTGEIMQT